jgi:UDP-N-acetylglucosamine acyltransferase
MLIHKTAEVHPRAEVADDVTIGAFCVVGEHVRIGAGTVVGNRVTLTGNATIGRRNRICDGAVLGTPPQDTQYRGEPTALLIGDDNCIREFVTINVGTLKGGAVTIIGSRNYLMACSHVAHDCVLGDDIIMANSVLLGGHVKVESGCFFSGNAGVHHYGRIGRLAFVGASTGVTQDLAPYMMADGHRAFPRGVNVVGLKRHGFGADRINAVQEAFRHIYRSRHSVKTAVAEMSQRSDLTPDVAYLIEFLQQSGLDKNGRYLETSRVTPP